MRAGLVVLLAACGGASSRAAHEEPLPPDTLAPVVELRDPASRAVTFRVVFAAGSADDPAGREGAAWVAAHLAAERGTRALDATAFTRALYPIAGEVDVHVGRDQTVLYGRVHRDELERFYPLLRDVLLAPRMGEEDFRRIREQARAALTLELRGGDDEALGKEMLQSVIYAGHPFGHPEVGTERGLAALTLEDVRHVHDGLFCRGRAQVGIAGGEPEGFAARLEHDLAALPACGRPRAELPAVRLPGARRLTVVDKPAAAWTAISMGVPSQVGPGHPDHAALALAFAYLGQHRQFAGVLFQKLRSDRGLNYGDYAYAEHFEQEGWSRYPQTNVARRQQYWSLWLRPVKPDNAHFAIRAAVRELEGLVAQGIPADKFEAIRTFARRYYQLFVQTESRRLGYALDARFYAMPRPPIDTLRDAWARIDRAAVAAALRRHIHPAALAIVAVAPNGRALADAIAADAPSPIVYDAPKPDEITAEDRTIATYPLRIPRARAHVVPVNEVFR